MQLTFLGTSSGTPTKSRNVSAIAIKSENSKFWCLIDCGEGTQHRVLNTKLSLNHLEAIFITHVHGDHCFGLPGLLASASLMGRTEPLTLVGPAGINQYIKTAQLISETILSYEINFIEVSEFTGQYKTRDFSIRATELSHRVPSYAYVFEEANLEKNLNIDQLKTDAVEAGPAWGQLQKGKDVELQDGRLLHASDYLLTPRKARKIIIAGDNDNPDLLQPYADGLDVLVHEATFTQDVYARVGKFTGHSTASSVAKFAQNISLKNLILTHFSARYSDFGESPVITDISDEASKEYNGTLFLAQDLEVFTLNKDGVLKKKEH